MTSPLTTVPNALQNIHRIVFLGDSITQGGDYVTDIECWLLSRGLAIEVIDVGLSSETATDLTEEENAPHRAAHGFLRPQVSQRLALTLAIDRRQLLQLLNLPPAAGDPPFKGLQYFDVADADLFFGREALTAKPILQPPIDAKTPGAAR